MYIVSGDDHDVILMPLQLYYTLLLPALHGLTGESMGRGGPSPSSAVAQSKMFVFL